VAPDAPFVDSDTRNAVISAAVVGGVVVGTVTTSVLKSVVGVSVGMRVPPSKLGSRGCEAPDGGGGTGLPVPALLTVVVVAGFAVVGGDDVVGARVITEPWVVGARVVVVVGGSVWAQAKPVIARNASAPASREMYRRTPAS